MIELAARIEGLAGADNAVDVLVELALFEPDDTYVSARANAAGSKVIYTRRDGGEQTCWAPDWTMDRKGAAAAIRARADG